MKTNNQGWNAESLLQRQEAVDNFCETYLRLATPDRRKVLRLLERLAYRKAGTNSYFDRWTTDDMRSCYLQFQRISQEVAKRWRRWASVHSKAGLNNRLVIICLVDTLVCQMWIEESSADSGR